MRSKTIRFYGVLMMALMSVSACTVTGVATTMGAVGGIAAAREGGLKQSAIDTRIAMEINDLWFKYDTSAFLKLNLTVEQGRVLVTGVVQNPDHRVEAIRLAWQPKGVVQVINEVRVANSEGITGYARDSWITGKLRTKMIFDRDIQSINYTIDTVQSVVYLMGIAQDQAELNKVIALARDTGYVKDVVSYVKLLGQPVETLVQPIDQHPVAPQPLTNNYNSNYTTPVPSSPLPQQSDIQWQDNTQNNAYQQGDYQHVYQDGYGYKP